MEHIYFLFSTEPGNDTWLLAARPAAILILYHRAVDAGLLGPMEMCAVKTVDLLLGTTVTTDLSTFLETAIPDERSGSDY